jgi:cytochrome oxidase Cu insertion factor (SCO1/SenC/PrrC family)
MHRWRGWGPWRLTLVWVGLALAGLPCLDRGVLATDAPEVADRLHGIDPADLAYTFALGSFTPEYTPPAPGSYALPVIKTVADHALLGADGQATSLFALKRARLAVVAFVYTTCTEAVGCPLSQAVMQHVDRALAADPELARQVVLLTISFDPERDTPARMQTVSGFYQPQTDWRFVTTRSDTELQPLLDDFGQPVAKLRFADGQWSGLFRHVLKVFLLDATNHVRNIYSVGFLNPQLVVNDLRTVLMASPGEAAPAAAQ